MSLLGMPAAAKIPDKKATTDNLNEKAKGTRKQIRYEKATRGTRKQKSD